MLALLGATTFSLAGLTAVPLTAPAYAAGPDDFDLQAHRGGLGLTVESTLPAFAKALELGVSTLELDVQVTEDRVAVVTHDRRVSGAKCLDTTPATAGDPEFPYVGDYVTTLTLAQVQTLDCGSQRLAGHPDQELHPGERMPTLAQVLDLVDRYDARDVTLNIETKVEAGAPSETAPREQFVQEVVSDVRAAGLVDQVTIQSFDWGALMRMAEVEPRFPLVALTNRDFLQVDQPGASPWLGGLDIDDFDDSLVAAAASFGASAISPVHGFPQDGRVADAGYEPYVTPEMVSEAHAAGLAVIPWTVDDVPTMASLMDAGVDGLITDYPDRLRDLMEERGLRLPRAYDEPRREEADVPPPGAPYTVLQMNLCLSGLAGCYGGTEYPKVVDEAVATVRAQDPAAVTLNEACSGDADTIAARTGYQVRFATVLYRGAPLECRSPGGRGVFGNAVLTKERIVATTDRAFTAQAGVEERRWSCATTAREVTACTAHLSTRGTDEARAANDAQCEELREVLARYAGRGATVFGGDVNRYDSCAPAGLWTQTDAAATQAPGIQHVYGSSALRDPVARIVPATFTDHDFLAVTARLAPPA